MDIEDIFGGIFRPLDTKEQAINDYIQGKITKEQLDKRMRALQC